MKSSSRWRLVLLVLGVGWVVVGWQFLVLSGFDCDLPLRDEWKYAIQQIVLADQQGTLNWQTFVAPLIGHYMLYSKLLVWLQWKMAGQIDFLVANALNGYVLAVLAMLVLALVRKIRPGMDFAWALMCALIFGLPHSFEGLFMVMCNGYLFFAILAVSLFLMIPFSGEVSPLRLLLVLFLGAAGILSYEVGYLAPLTVIGVMMVRWISRSPGEHLRSTVTILISLILVMVVGAGLFPLHGGSSTGPVDWRSIGVTLNNALGWPLRFLPGCALLTWAPVLILARGRWRHPDWRKEEGWGLLVCLILWSGALALSIAAARPTAHGSIYSRYEQFLVFNLVANAATAAFLAGRVTKRTRGFLTMWALVLGTAFIVRCAIISVEYLPRFYAGELWQRQQLGRYLYQPEARLIPEEEPVGAGMFKEDIRAVLETPSLRFFLPPSIVPSLPVFFDASASNQSAEVNGLPAPVPRFFPWILEVPNAKAGQGEQRLWLKQDFTEAHAFQFWLLQAPEMNVVFQEKQTNQVFTMAVQAASDNRWESYSIILPPGEYEMHATADRASYWLAGGFPISRMNLAIRWLIHQAGYFLGSGCLLILAGGCLFRSGDRRSISKTSETISP